MNKKINFVILLLLLVMMSKGYGTSYRKKTKPVTPTPTCSEECYKQLLKTNPFISKTDPNIVVCATKC